MPVSVSNFAQIIRTRESQTCCFLKLFAGTKFYENGLKLQQIMKFNTFKVY